MTYLIYQISTDLDSFEAFGHPIGITNNRDSFIKVVNEKVQAPHISGAGTDEAVGEYLYKAVGRIISDEDIELTIYLQQVAEV